MIARTLIAVAAGLGALMLLLVLLAMINWFGTPSKALGAGLLIFAIGGAVWTIDWYTSQRVTE